MGGTLVKWSRRMLGRGEPTRFSGQIGLWVTGKPHILGYGAELTLFFFFLSLLVWVWVFILGFTH